MPAGSLIAAHTSETRMDRNVGTRALPASRYDFPYLAFDGANFLVTWTDLSNDANGNFGCDIDEGLCADVAGQLVHVSGALVGPNFAITADAGSQGQSPTVFGAGRYLVAWTSGFDTSNSDVHGTFVASDGVFRDGFE